MKFLVFSTLLVAVAAQIPNWPGQEQPPQQQPPQVSFKIEYFCDSNNTFSSSNLVAATADCSTKSTTMEPQPKP